MNHGPAHDLNLLVLEEKEIDGKVINTKEGVLFRFRTTGISPLVYTNISLMVSSHNNYMCTFSFDPLPQTKWYEPL